MGLKNKMVMSTVEGVKLITKIPRQFEDIRAALYQAAQLCYNNIVLKGPTSEPQRKAIVYLVIF